LISIGVFGSSRPGEGEAAYEEARQLGRAIARRSGRVVCGGYGGVMEAACRGAAEAGGQSLGVIFESGGEPNRWVTEARRVVGLGERLRQLRDSSDAWVFLPHGLGTMLELAWMAESVAKGAAPSRALILVGDFWRRTVETMLAEAAGPAAEILAACVRWAQSPEEAVELAFGERSA
jgi:uncharacterized protein (TIGR00725 family)